MLHIENYIYAADLQSAYTMLTTEPGCTILGGCGYLRLGDRKINTAIDLSKLGLDYIRKAGERIEIGAMATLRSVETDPLTAHLAGGILPKALSGIVGVQLRDTVTLGGTVAGRYPFSDPITALMALDAGVVLHHRGEIPLEEYLHTKPGKDIVVKIVIPDDDRAAAFTSVRKNATDYAVLNVAVAQKKQQYRVIVGARPGRALQVDAAADFLQGRPLSEDIAGEAGRLAAEALQFGDNPRGSAAYRKAICPVLVRRALVEVMHAA